MVASQQSLCMVGLAFIAGPPAQSRYVVQTNAFVAVSKIWPGRKLPCDNYQIPSKLWWPSASRPKGSRRRASEVVHTCFNTRHEERRPYHDCRAAGEVRRAPTVIMSASSSPQSSSGTGGPWAGGGWDGYSAPTGPGAGLLDLKFSALKTGGFKVFLLFFLLGQGRAKDNDVPFQVLSTEQGIRLLIGEDDNSEQWQGVLDLSWGMDPQPFFRVDRIDVNEIIPYPGELYVLNKLLDAIIDIHGEQAIAEKEKLFLFAKGDSQLADAKAKLASLASLRA